MSKSKKSIPERLAELESVLPQLLDIVNNNVNNRVDPIIRHLNAVSELLGKASVEAKITEMESQAATEEMERTKAALTEAVAKGELVKTEAPSAKTIVVATHVNPDGTVVHPGRLQIAVSEVASHLQEKMLAAKAGDSIDLPTGGKLQLLEFYDFVPKMPPAAIQSPVVH